MASKSRCPALDLGKIEPRRFRSRNQNVSAEARGDLEAGPFFGPVVSGESLQHLEHAHDPVSSGVADLVADGREGSPLLGLAGGHRAFSLARLRVTTSVSFSKDQAR